MLVIAVDQHPKQIVLAMLQGSEYDPPQASRFSPLRASPPPHTSASPLAHLKPPVAPVQPSQTAQTATSSQADPESAESSFTATPYTVQYRSTPFDWGSPMAPADPVVSSSASGASSAANHAGIQRGPVGAVGDPSSGHDLSPGQTPAASAQAESVNRSDDEEQSRRRAAEPGLTTEQPLADIAGMTPLSFAIGLLL